MTSIFPAATLDRAVMRWEDHLLALTPFEQHDGVWYKREDHFAPLGYGGPNGAKLRQLVRIFDLHLKGGGAARAVSAASILSPQLSMVALTARHYGMDATLVVGGTAPRTAFAAPNVAMAARAGAEFRFTAVGYNPSIQKAAGVLLGQPEFRAALMVPYGITTPPDAEDDAILDFHSYGAHQVRNVPAGVRTLAMVAGSCNSCVSVMYGIALHPPANLERLVLFGIGPTRLHWIEERLARIERATGLRIRSRFARRYEHHRDIEAEHQTRGDIVMQHFDLHATRYTRYDRRAPFALSDGLAFHPTYEGKALRYIHERPRRFDWFHRRDGAAAFWIVGGEADPAVVDRALLGEELAAREPLRAIGAA